VYGELRKVYRIFLVNSEGIKRVERLRCRWEGNITMDLNENCRLDATVSVAGSREREIVRSDSS
jgi:hypothetical protein